MLALRLLLGDATMPVLPLCDGTSCEVLHSCVCGAACMCERLVTAAVEGELAEGVTEWQRATCAFADAPGIGLLHAIVFELLVAEGVTE